MQGSRRFIDSTGFSWQVWEIASRARSTTLAGHVPSPGWLYFFSRGTTLVLRRFPRDWEALSWGELEELRRDAEVLGSDSEVRLPMDGARRVYSPEVGA